MRMAVCFSLFVKGRQPMETRIAAISIIVSDRASAEELNSILHTY